LRFLVLGGVQLQPYLAEPVDEFFTFAVPLGCVCYYPMLAILDRSDQWGSPAWVGWASPLAGVLFLLIALRQWRLGVRHYYSTGN
jgi:ABC-2 type transport system permease protein